MSMEPIQAELKCVECGTVTIVGVWVFDEAEIKQSVAPSYGKVRKGIFDVHIYCINCKHPYNWNRIKREFVTLGGRKV